jgi:hypothetical protein
LENPIREKFKEIGCELVYWKNAARINGTFSFKTLMDYWGAVFLPWF